MPGKPFAAPFKVSALTLLPGAPAKLTGHTGHVAKLWGVATLQNSPRIAKLFMSSEGEPQSKPG